MIGKPKLAHAAHHHAIISPLLNAATRAIGSDIEVFQLSRPAALEGSCGGVQRTLGPRAATTLYSSDLNLNIQIGDHGDEIEFTRKRREATPGAAPDGDKDNPHLAKDGMGSWEHVATSSKSAILNSKGQHNHLLSPTAGVEKEGIERDPFSLAFSFTASKSRNRKIPVKYGISVWYVNRVHCPPIEIL